ncbi:MAG: DDE-type integrase/transposase/recombinase, partial [Pseudonocardiaceae bacterium]|nr:DDE-type integrase/transposase/recombinase [Pseudonocardiaceae bacterium]
ADLTRVMTGEGVLWLATIRDAFSNKIVGWCAHERATADLVLAALNYALWSRDVREGQLVHHSDKGCQYTAIRFTQRLADAGIAPSTGSVGDSFDNALAESTIGLFKTELHRNPAALAEVGGHWKGLDDLEIATCGWVSWFNDERIHGELDDLTPAEVEDAYRHQSQPNAA